MKSGFGLYWPERFSKEKKACYKITVKAKAQLGACFMKGLNINWCTTIIMY